MGWSEAEATTRISASVEQTLRQTLDLAAEQHISAADAARNVAEARLR
jgi:hypothetical protein